MRQLDVAQRSGVSQSTVSQVELGRLAHVSTAALRAIAEAVGADCSIDLRWRGADLDRLLDGRHAALVSATMSRVTADGWTTRPEVSYSIYGERGSIDVLAWHHHARALLVIEVKTALSSLEETLRRHDAKVRLGPRIAREHFGWEADRAARLLVFPDLTTPRRHVARAATVLATAYPVRGIELRNWLREPGEPVSGLLFLSPASLAGRSHRIGRLTGVVGHADAAGGRDSRPPASPSGR